MFAVAERTTCVRPAIHSMERRPVFPRRPSWHGSGKRGRSMRSSFLVVAAALVALAGCRKDAAEQRRRADEAEAKAKANQATLTSGTLEANGARDAAAEQADDLRDRALASRAQSLVAFRNEQIRYRERIEAEIGRIEHTDEPRRELLEHDLLMLDHATEGDWAPLRGELDRHLAAGAVRVVPRQVPR